MSYKEIEFYALTKTNTGSIRLKIDTKFRYIERGAYCFSAFGYDINSATCPENALDLEGTLYINGDNIDDDAIAITFSNREFLAVNTLVTVANHNIASRCTCL